MTTKEKNWKVIELPKTGKREKRSWYENTSVPYCTAFVYSKYHGNFIVKGYSNDVTDYLKENYTHYFYSMLLHGRDGDWTFWRFWKDGWYLSGGIEKTRRGVVREPFTLTKFRDGGRKEYKFKRMPSRWIPLMDKCK